MQIQKKEDAKINYYLQLIALDYLTRFFGIIIELFVPNIKNKRKQRVAILLIRVFIDYVLAQQKLC